MTRYVIITPAHNEETFIDMTIRSVISQTVLPLRWVVVNDGSTDRTQQIVERHVPRHDFIESVCVERPAGRHFGNKVRAFNQGLAAVRELDYDFIGNLDADIALESDYFERILSEFGKDPDLGIAGGMVSSRIGDTFVSQEVALDSVAGAVQLFRRECFEQIGGYCAMPSGGIDAAAEIAARMHGWRTRTIPELSVLEHRRTGSATARPLASRVKEGRRMHSLGYSLPFFLIRCIYRMMERPVVVGSAAALCGYFASVLSREPPVVSPNMVRFLRSEQRTKLRRLLRFSR